MKVNLVLEARCLPFATVSKRTAAEGVKSSQWSPEWAEQLSEWDQSLLPCILPFIREGLQKLRLQQQQEEKKRNRRRNTPVNQEEEKKGEETSTSPHHQSNNTSNINSPQPSSSLSSTDCTGKEGSSPHHHQEEEEKRTASPNTEHNNEEVQKELGKEVVRMVQSDGAPSAKDVEQEYRIALTILRNLGDLEEAYYRLKDTQTQVNFVRNKLVGKRYGSFYSRRHQKNGNEAKKDEGDKEEEEDDPTGAFHASSATSASSSSFSDTKDDASQDTDDDEEEEDGCEEYSWWPTDEDMGLILPETQKDVWEPKPRDRRGRERLHQLMVDQVGERQPREVMNEEEGNPAGENGAEDESGGLPEKNDEEDNNEVPQRVGAELGEFSSESLQHMKDVLHARTGVPCEEEAFFQLLAQEQLHLWLKSEKKAEKDKRRKEEQEEKALTLKGNSNSSEVDPTSNSSGEAKGAEGEGMEEDELNLFKGSKKFHHKKRTHRRDLRSHNGGSGVAKGGLTTPSHSLRSPIAEGMNPAVDIAMCFDLAMGGECCGISTSSVLGGHGLHSIDYSSLS